eukprot:TRINITY_DN25696_c0_g1_i1.p2 TRINITY_DN25696_c0_g1~~TRINITY_DN25696_c0_g1_i1.p2  ORF type:complete len:300 (+),score=146.47 TRINITY_DN25696_c0_g1_i1:75-902(+)
MSLDESVDKKIEGLSANSKGLVNDLFGACKDKKLAFAKELEYEMNRYQKSMLREGVYSKSEVETLLSSFFTGAQGVIQNELRSQTNLAADFYAQLFSCADAKGLSLDPPRIPGAIDNTPAFLQKGHSLAPKTLQSLESATSSDAKVNEELKQVERDNARQQEKIERITAQFKEMMTLKAELGTQLIQAQSEVQVMKEKYGNESADEVASLQIEIKKLKADNESAKRALAAKLGESPQWNNLKKMIAKKNEDLTSLRAQLQDHELVYADDEDDPLF